MVAKNGVAARQHLLHTFLIEHKSEQDDMEYNGKFTTKKMSIADMAALGVRKTQLNGGYHYSEGTPGLGVDAGTDDFNSMIAHLEISLQDFPIWWDLENISDVDLIGMVFKEVLNHENSFLERRRRAAADARSQPTAAGEGDSAEAADGSGAGGVAGEMVGEEVLAALEP
jgi:hypothetical protein